MKSFAALLCSVAFGALAADPACSQGRSLQAPASFRPATSAMIDTALVATAAAAAPDAAQTTTSSFDGAKRAQTPSGAAPAPAPTDAATGSDIETVGLQDIVVTAQRREESLQRAAIAVSAVAGSRLASAGISDVTNLSKLVPALVVQQGLGSSTNFYVRGVGTSAGNAFNENAIAFSFNGVYVGRASAPLGTFYDLDRVEVLKGPQGTLYGRNATGGAINVLPRRPALSGVSGEAVIEVGNYDNVRGQAAVNVPLGSMLALRVAGQVVKRDGYLSDGYDDEDGRAARVSLLFQPVSALSMLLVADYAKLDAKGAGAVLVPGPVTPTAPAVKDRVGGSDPRSLAELQLRFAQIRSGLIIGPGNDGYVTGEFMGISNTINADLGFADLTVIPAYRHNKPNYLTYANGYFARNTETDNQMSLEARLSSKPGQRLGYVAGVFYFDEKQHANNLFNQGPVSITNFIANIYNESYAAFGQATFAVVPTFRLVGGIRFTHENKRQSTQLQQRTLANTNPPFIQVMGSRGFDSTTYKAGVEFDAAPASLLFANVATGFKSGGFFVGIGDNTFAPERLTAFTVGSKNRLLNNRLQLNLEGFYWRYRDQQITYVGPIQTGPTTFGSGGRVANAGNSRLWGAELEVRFQLSSADLFSADIQYINSRYNQFIFRALSASGATPRTACSATPVAGSPIAPPAQLFDVNCSGRSLVNAPEWSFDLSYEHRFDLGGDWALAAFAHSRVESSRYLSLDYLPEERQGSYMVSDLLLTLEAPGKRWSIAAYVNNLENRTLLAGAAIRPFLNAVYAPLRPPRTYGVRATARF